MTEYHDITATVRDHPDFEDCIRQLDQFGYSKLIIKVGLILYLSQLHNERDEYLATPFSERDREYNLLKSNAYYYYVERLVVHYGPYKSEKYSHIAQHPMD